MRLRQLLINQQTQSQTTEMPTKPVELCSTQEESTEPCPPIAVEQQDSTPAEIVEEKLPSRDELMKKIIERFADECLEFSYSNLIQLRDVRLAYSSWLIKQPEFGYDFSMRLNLSELCRIIPKYRFRNISICKSCRQRIFKDCCEFHDRLKNQSTSMCLINARLK